MLSTGEKGSTYKCASNVLHLEISLLTLYNDLFIYFSFDFSLVMQITSRSQRSTFIVFTFKCDNFKDQKLKLSLPDYCFK